MKVHGRFDNPVSAALAGFRDFFRKQDLAARWNETGRIDGKTCLVTGANSGLGFGVAVHLARLGGKVVMANRRQLDVAAANANRESNTANVQARYVDMSKIPTIHQFVQDLKNDKITLDVIILNAGVALPKSRKTDSGLEEMFLVNYLSNFMLVNLLLRAGLIHTENNFPRIIFISSDSHQGASAIDFDEFGKFIPYGVSGGINLYSYYKLVLNTLAVEMSRRLNRDELKMGVNAICPGPVNTNIIKEAPWILRIILGGIFSIIFKKPSVAARAVVYMATSEDYHNKTGEYLHMFNKKRMDEKVYDEQTGQKLWQKSMELWKSVDRDALEE